MVSKLRHLVVATCLCASTLAQEPYELAIPPQEAVTLSQLVEDDPGKIVHVTKDGESPPYPLMFQVPLPIPPVAQPKQIITNPVTGEDILYFEVEIRPFQQQVYPNLSPATLVGYDGISPGPTFIIPQGTESVVRFVNNAEMENSVHLHGSPSRAPFDGWAADETFPGEYKDYYYPNFESARLLWYHDHALGITAENAYFGQAGAYILSDAREDVLGLPSGYGEFDIPMILAAKFYNRDGTLQSTLGEEESTWGDVIHVNGQPWPFLDVQPRRYRLRFLDAAVSRNFALYFARAAAAPGDGKLPFQVIASDSGLLERPVTASQLLIAVAERYEVVFDFAPFAGQAVDLRNAPEVGGFGVDDDFADTDKVMRFVVAGSPGDDNVVVVDNSTVPDVLRDVPFPPATAGIDHRFRFHRTQGEWRINGVGFEDAEHRVLANVPRGTVEIWELENGSGGWTHPIHVHLVDFKVLQRSGGDRGVEPYEQVALKDVVWLAKGETVLVEAHYAPWNGVYMFHCHNLIHEDHDMMAAFNVTRLQDFGYDEVTDFGDPEDPRWSARPYALADFRAGTGPFAPAAVEARVQEMARQQPYSELGAVEAALDAFWAGRDIGDPGAALRPPTATADPTPLPLPTVNATGPVPRFRRFVV
ncbi:Cupredoxin [Xylariomycetidae sp. FL0641]|nr:Cupredoxin [Xylariomycetidae sp. FL0641]